MNRKRMLLVALVVLASVAGAGCGYNTLNAKQQNVRGKWANVESALQRRADLTNNLFEAAKAAAIQEQQVFGDIAAARSQLLNRMSEQPQGQGGDRTPEQKQAIIDANNSFGGTIGRLLSLVENYPQLKSTESFQKFMDSIEGTENRINTARTDYNTAVQDYNTTRGSFPTVIGAKIYGFKEEPYFKAEPTATQVPRIDANSIRRDQGK
jgi:LemA protein